MRRPRDRHRQEHTRTGIGRRRARASHTRTPALRSAVRFGLGLAAAGGAGLLAVRALRERRSIDLAGRVALITGSSRGLGLLLAREFADQGCRIVICARDAQQLERARESLEARGATVLDIVCDVADAGQVEHMIEQATRHFGPIDIVVNNAGIIQVGPLETMTRDDFETMMDIVFGGTLNTTLAVLPQMRERGEGRIVNITSIGARAAVPHLLPYGAAKFAQRGLSEGLAAELARDGIRVTTVMPGLMRTGSPVNALFKGQPSLEFAWFSVGDAIPLTSMSAERAARRIVETTRRGENVLTLSWQAKLLGLIHDLFPGSFVTLAGLANRLLPSSGGAGESATRGMQLTSPVSPSPLTTLMNRAAKDHNQYGGTSTPAPEHADRVGLR